MPSGLGQQQSSKASCHQELYDAKEGAFGAHALADAGMEAADMERYVLTWKGMYGGTQLTILILHLFNL